LKRTHFTADDEKAASAPVFDVTSV